MSETKWIDLHQPQTLVNACYLLYFTAAFYLFYLVLGRAGAGLELVVTLGGAAGAYGIANEKKVGWIVAIVCSVIGLVLSVFFTYLIFTAGTTSDAIWSLIGLGFAIAKVVLLLHRDSRAYARIWFK